MAMAMAALLLLLLFAAPEVHSLQYNVPWNDGINYNKWVAGKIFTVGDILVFTYTAFHSVDIVDQSDYTSCKSANALHSYSGGKTTIPLTTPGPMYFLCPTMGHCQSGMKLNITVVAAASTTTTSSQISLSAGRAMFGKMNKWVGIGCSVGVAGLVGFMG